MIYLIHCKNLVNATMYPHPEQQLKQKKKGQGKGNEDSVAQSYKETWLQHDKRESTQGRGEDR
jgi:hypothetical protein